MEKIKQGDEVMVIAGRSKGARGTVLRILERDRLLVENVNMVKKHTKPNPNEGVAGGIVDKESPIHRSNIALFNAATSKADKVGIRTLEDGRKVRFFKSTGEVVDI